MCKRQNVRAMPFRLRVLCQVSLSTDIYMWEPGSLIRYRTLPGGVNYTTKIVLTELFIQEGNAICRNNNILNENKSLSHTKKR